jgi:hypothetical protein
MVVSVVKEEVAADRRQLLLAINDTAVSHLRGFTYIRILAHYFRASRL